MSGIPHHPHSVNPDDETAHVVVNVVRPPPRARWYTPGNVETLTGLSWRGFRAVAKAVDVDVIEPTTGTAMVDADAFDAAVRSSAGRAAMKRATAAANNDEDEAAAVKAGLRVVGGRR